jgi:hypothetical protein
VRKSLLSLLMLPLLAMADTEFTGEAGIEQRYFAQDALYPEQQRSQVSVYFEPEIYIGWNDGDDGLLFKPFYRQDSVDDERSHGDIRELIWLHVGEDWELRTGIGRVFWGQTESLHLVDVINQTDAVEAVDGEDKLGQPMVNLSLIREWGTTSIFVLPYFRERTFSGPEGRFRLPLEVDVDNPLYESKDEEENLDWAIRWQDTLGDWDVGLSYFDGTSREPMLVAGLEQGELKLRPYYPQMQQLGVDFLAVVDAWLLKFEGIHRSMNNEDYFAFVGGFEYTNVGVFNSIYDIGWLMEYQFDERDELATTAAQNDLMVGSRLVFNDVDGTAILIGVVQDLEHFSSRAAFVEASSRINDNWKWRMDVWLFSSDEVSDVLYSVRRDDFVQLSLEYYF